MKMLKREDIYELSNLLIKTAISKLNTKKIK